MKHEENALTIFAEELGELAAELLRLQNNLFKAIRFGIDEQRDLPTSNRERIESEWNDLLGSLEFLKQQGIDLYPNLEAIERKIKKNNTYTEYSKSLGKVE